MVKFIWKVTIAKSGEVITFENKKTAQAYVAYLRDSGEEAILNAWTWKVEVED
jgi:hypothetical protein